MGDELWTYYRLLTRQSLLNEFAGCNQRDVDDLIYDRIADVNALIADAMSFGRTRLASDHVDGDVIRDIPSLIRIIHRYRVDGADVNTNTETTLRRHVNDVALQSTAETLQMSASGLHVAQLYRCGVHCAASESSASQCAADLALVDAKLALVTAAARAKHFSRNVNAAHAHVLRVLTESIATCRSERAAIDHTTSAYDGRAQAERLEWSRLRSEYRHLQAQLAAKQWQRTQL